MQEIERRQMQQRLYASNWERDRQQQQRALRTAQQPNTIKKDTGKVGQIQDSIVSHNPR